jgi:hypothetical protein
MGGREMTTLDEAMGQETNQYAAALAQGVNTISLDQEVEFVLHKRLVLPLDGFVFWVRADLISNSALMNTSVLNTFAGNQSPKVETSAKVLTVQGSLHYATDTRQEEEETYAANRVVFTSEEEIQDLNDIGPDEVYIAEVEGLRVAFSSRGSFYRQTNLFHYIGFALYADMDTQLISARKDFSNKQVVSNSLPLWLGMNNYVPKDFEFFGNSIRLFPSYLGPNNLPPPYGVVHVEPRETKAIAAGPTFGRTMTHDQLCMDHVEITLWGVRNDQAIDFVDFVQEQAANYQQFGVMNMPVIRDEKRTQNELNIIAQKKKVTFDINYYQRRVNDLARQLILEAIPTFYIGD